METTTDSKSTIMLMEQNLSYKMLFFNIVTTISYAFFCQQWSRACVQSSLRSVPAEVACCCCHHCWNAQWGGEQCSHQFFGLHKQFSKSQWMRCFPCKGIQCHPFASSALPCHTILSEFPSAAICHTATTWNGISVGRFNLYCRTNTISLWSCGSTS